MTVRLPCVRAHVHVVFRCNSDVARSAVGMPVAAWAPPRLGRRVPDDQTKHETERRRCRLQVRHERRGRGATPPASAPSPPRAPTRPRDTPLARPRESGPET